MWVDHFLPSLHFSLFEEEWSSAVYSDFLPSLSLMITSKLSKFPCRPTTVQRLNNIGPKEFYLEKKKKTVSSLELGRQDVGSVL